MIELLMTAQKFIKRLEEKSDESLKKNVLKLIAENDKETKALGLKFGTVFKLAKEFSDLSLSEINKLLDSKYYEIRMGAVSIMDFQARNKKVSQDLKQKLFELYINRHDRINNWGLVDRGAVHIVGQNLIDKPRKILYKLAKSKNVWERRTSIAATHAFIKIGEVNDTFKIAELLIDDEQETINKAVGSWVREAGKKDINKLKDFLDKYAATMPRVTLRYAIEKFDRNTKKYYLNLKK